MSPEPALAAAQAVAREHGVTCDETVRIAAGSNALVHLRPSPVVARVMTATAVLHDDPEQWLTREVAVGTFLAERTDLVVPPSDLLPAGPHVRDGLWMTMWQFVPHDADAPPPEPRELGRSLRALHEALAGFTGELAPLSGIRDWLADLLAQLRPSPEAGTPRRRLDREPAADPERIAVERPRGRLCRASPVGRRRARGERGVARAQRGVHGRTARRLR